MQCTTAARLAGDAHAARLPSATRVCERAPERVGANAVFLNALHDAMPECDRTAHSATLADLAGARGDDAAPHCYVYCAQRSCGAAADFVTSHAEELQRGCSAVTYLRNGALGMRESELVDGAACHARVVEHNPVQETGGLNCGDAAVDVALAVDGRARAGAQYLRGRPTAPEWFKRASIWSRHPPQFSRDPRYANPPRAHDPRGAARVRLDTTGTGIAEDATLAFWASHPGEVKEAHAAYGDFTNSGIVRCERRTCDFTVDPPGAYTAAGKSFRPHVHVAEWKGDHWGDVGTVTLGKEKKV